MWDREVLAVIKRLNIYYLVYYLQFIRMSLYFTQRPILTLFSEDPISTMKAIKKEPAKLHWDLSKLYKVGIHAILYKLN